MSVLIVAEAKPKFFVVAVASPEATLRCPPLLVKT
jgi:hypothetical protein